MGGGHGDHPAYPRRVWTPYGGWWYTPANWKKNTQIGLIGAAISVFSVLIFSSNRERHLRNPVRPVPTQMIQKHTLTDMPDYYEKKAEYKKNKKSIFKRIFPTAEDEEH